MRNHTRIGIILLAALLIAACFACKGSDDGQPAESTYDFSDAGGGLPAGWSINSYEGLYTTSLADGVFGISSEIDDDCRLCCTVKVKAQTRYVLTATVKTENVIGGQGATLSIDNFAEDGSYIYSDGLYGTNDWTSVTLAFRTAKDQERVTLALRLGGYSNVSRGRVWFKNVSLTQSDNAPVAFQNLEPRDKTEEKGERTQEDYENVFTVIFWAGVIAAIALLFGFYGRAKTLAPRRDAFAEKYRVYGLLVLIGLFVRFILCANLKGHATDMACWQGWGYRVATYGPHAFYVDNWCDYPPGYMLICAVLYKISELFKDGPEALRLFVYMIPAFVCDAIAGLLLLRAAKRFALNDRLALLLAGLIVLNPAAVFLSGAWGQIDSILTVLLIGTFLLLNGSREKPWLRFCAGLLYGVAILMKWQALIFGPVLALMYLMTGVDQFGTKRFFAHVLWSVAAVCGALLVLLLGSVLFRGEGMPLTWMVERYQSASSGYDYASIEAYNWFTLLGGNWAKANVDVFNGASVGGILIKCNELFGKVAALIALPTLILRAWQGVRTRREGEPNTALRELLYAAAIYGLLFLLSFVSENFTADNGGAQAVLEALGSFSPGGLFTIVLFAVLVKRERKKTPLFDWIKTGGVTATGAITLFFAVLLFGWTFLLAAAARIFGAELSFKAFGTLGIITAGVLTLALFVVYWIRHRNTRYSLYVNRGLIFLLAACFNIWVFTFGHFMHERYIFPALFLLLFAYGYDRDPHKLAAFCMLTVTTFMNEMTAMYVVSDGANELIRGGVLHNKMIALVSLLEVCAVLYFSATAVRKAILFTPGDPADEAPEPQPQKSAARAGRDRR